MNSNRRQRVLVVDDDPLARSALTELLTQDGFEVASAGTVAAALETLAWFPADAVVTDFRMPGNNGLELLVSVGKLLPNCMRVLVTSTVLDRERIGSLAHVHFAKPLDLDALEAVLTHAAA